MKNYFLLIYSQFCRSHHCISHSNNTSGATDPCSCQSYQKPFAYLFSSIVVNMEKALNSNGLSGTRKDLRKSRISVRPLSCYCLNSGDQWGEQQKQICTISTVKEFWEAMNNIKPAFLLPVNSIYHLFKVWLSFPHQDYFSPV